MQTQFSLDSLVLSSVASESMLAKGLPWTNPPKPVQIAEFAAIYFTLPKIGRKNLVNYTQRSTLQQTVSCVISAMTAPTAVVLAYLIF